MNIYSQKQYYKFLLFVLAVLIGLSSLWYTNQLVDKLAVEERKKVELWAEATRQLASAQSETDLSFIFKVIVDNKTVPVILADEDNKIISWVNLDSAKAISNEYLVKQLASMKEENPPIEVIINEKLKQYIFYKNSILLTQLMYFPFIQLGVISLFILVSYYAFSISRKAEQNQVWMGMAKETAHQLGTPLSSLMAWHEVLKSKSLGDETLDEFENDLKRLEVITDRFSKIGSIPKLTSHSLDQVLADSINYLRSRLPNKIKFEVSMGSYQDVVAPLNKSLFEWVIENLCKNAVDAMRGNGTIKIVVADQTQFVYIDIKDTGKGMPKKLYKRVFQPGFTTKERGWGLGLSLCKRIVENYHQGKVFVKSSEQGKGTTFRIVLNK
jgi:nitrogen-specific signal transduction histidine kinase